MAAILQLRRGAISEFTTYSTNLSEPYFDTDRDSIHIGTITASGSSADFITIAKLSLANRDSSKHEPNTGSFWLTGDYTGSNALIYDNLKVSGSVFIEEDLHLEGHLYLGSGSDGDVVTVRSDFSGSLIPDNDNFGNQTTLPTDGYHDLGGSTKRWRNIYLTKDGTSGAKGFLSGSDIDLTGNIKVDSEGRFGTLRVDDLVDNRIVVTGPGGEIEYDDNLQWDGDGITIIGDYYQSKVGASFQFDGSGMDITGSISNYELRVDNGIVFTNEFGTLDNSVDFTWDGGTLYVDGDISGSGTLEIDGQSTLASLNVEDLTNDRILIAGTNGEVEDDQYFTYDGNQFDIGQGEFTVQRLNGNTSISGSVQMFSTLNVDGQSTLASVNVEDLTDNRVVIVGAGGEIEDDVNFTFDGTELNIGTDNFTVQQGSGNTQILGTLDVDSQSTLSSLNVQDLTDNRIVIAGTSGEIEDDANLTFNGTELNIGTDNFTVQQGSGNTQILGTLDVDSQSTLSSVNVQDLTSGRVVLAGTSGEIEDSGNLTFDGSLLTVTGDTTITGNLTVQGDTTQLNVSTLNVEDKNILIASGAADASAANGGGITIDGADATILYSSGNDSFQLNKQLQVEGNISGSSFGGTTLLSSSNENFADYSQSVDTRLDSIEGPMSTSLDSRLIEIFATGSDHETRVDLIEGTMSSSFDLRILESFSTASDHETRLDAQELHSSSFTSNDLDMNGNKVLFGNVYSTEGDLPAAGTYHGMFAHVHGTGKGYFAHGGNWIPLLNESTFTTDSSSFDSRIDAQESFSTSLDDTFATEAEVNLATSSLSSSLAVDIASNLSEITNLNSFSESIESHLPSGIISGSDQLEGYVSSSSSSGIEVMTSASYAAITPVSGTLYIIQG